MSAGEFLAAEDVEFEFSSYAVTGQMRRSGHSEMPATDRAQAVLLRADHGFRYFVAVLSADRRIDLGTLSRRLGHCQLDLASDVEVANHFSRGDWGGVSPFGSEFGLRTLLDDSLAEDAELVFDAVQMRVADFRRVEQPLLVDLAGPRLALGVGIG